MNQFNRFAFISALSVALCASTALAQNPNYGDRPQNAQQGNQQGRPGDNRPGPGGRPGDNRPGPGGRPGDNQFRPGPGRRGGGPPNGYVHHSNWRRGRRIQRNDWNRGQVVDYRRYHLSAPRRGYQWRQVDGNFVLAAVATGLISSVIAASAAQSY